MVKIYPIDAHYKKKPPFKAFDAPRKALWT
jgi:hypothetical protein